MLEGPLDILKGSNKKYKLSGIFHIHGYGPYLGFEATFLTMLYLEVFIGQIESGLSMIFT